MLAPRWFQKFWATKTQFDAAPFLINIINEQFSSWDGIVIYMIGILAAAFHFSNGLWGFCVSWGILIGKKSQRNASIAFILVGLLLTFMGFATVAEFALHPIPVEATIGGTFLMARRRKKDCRGGAVALQAFPLP